ncbi:uncharacterized protein LOC127711392 [Mytilus californianus]|uniref:uncharacterized protein LOC127711392 n=1 Tax=Mytilus californianus TaxID=6549 RepID=UPI0022464D5B|nr:uncharacterized protein LOC127711392 [Mytilus californianus]
MMSRQAAGYVKSSKTNNARLGRAIEYLLPHYFQEIIVQKIKSGALQNAVTNNKYLKTHLNPDESLQITTATKHGYANAFFDITLIYKIVRNLQLVQAPTKGWGGGYPDDKDTTVGDDLERIRVKRNTIIHEVLRRDSYVTDKELGLYFTLFKAMASRLERDLGVIPGDFVQKFVELQVCSMDEEIMKSYLEAVETSRKRLLDEIKNPSLSNSQQIIVHKWEEEDVNFVKTNAADTILQLFTTDACVLVKGAPGDGKSTTIRHVALILHNMNKYEIVPCKGPNCIEKYYKKDRYQVFVIDDLCGKYNFDQLKADEWSNSFIKEFMTRILELGKAKFLTSVRLQICGEDRFKVFNFLNYKSVDLSDKKMVTLEQKYKILTEHLTGDAAKMLEKYEDRISDISLSPLLVSLIYDGMDIALFLQNPLDFYWNEFDKLQVEQLCALFLFTVYNGHIESKFTKSENKQTISTIAKAFIERSNPIQSDVTNLISKHLNLLSGKFLVNKDGVFTPKHNELFDIICYYFGTKEQDIFIQYAHAQVIGQRTVFESFNLKNLIQFTILIKKENEEMYFLRMVKNICYGKIWDAFNNFQLLYILQFKLRFVTYLERLSDTEKDKMVEIRERSDGTSISMPVSLLYVASYFGSLHLVKFVLKHSNVQLKDDQDEYPPLIASCERGHEEVVKLLIDKEANANQSGHLGTTPTIAAIQNNHMNLVKILIDNGADINKDDHNGMTPFLWACVLQREDIVNFLIDKEANINETSRDGSSSLFWCCVMGYQELVCLLQDKGEIGSISKPNKDGKTPLMAACYFRRFNIVHYLLKHLTSYDEVDKNGWTALMEACFNNDNGSWNRFLKQFDKQKSIRIPLFRLLSKKGDMIDAYYKIIEKLVERTNLNLQDTDGKSALHHACEGQYNHIVHILTEKGASVNLVDKRKSTPLMGACFSEDNETVRPIMEDYSNGCKPMIEQLLLNAADVNAVDKRGWNPFFDGCQKGNFTIVKRLIRFVADVNKRYRNGKTPIEMARECGNHDIIDLLIQEGANPGVNANEEADCVPEMGHSYHMHDFSDTSSDGSNPDEDSSVQNFKHHISDRKKGEKLLNACIDENEDEVKDMLESALEYHVLDFSNRYGKTPLLEACRVKNVTIVNLLLEAGANVNKDDAKFWAPLHEACKVGEKDIVNLLLEKNVNINACDDRGYSPLLIASQNGYKSIVELLVNYRAHVNISSNVRITPLLAACTKGQIEITKLLIVKRADINKADGYGNTPLMVASYYGHGSIVDQLLAKGCEIDQKDMKGWTALSWASKGSSKGCCKCIIDASVKRKYKDLVRKPSDEKI